LGDESEIIPQLGLIPMMMDSIDEVGYTMTLCHLMINDIIKYEYIIIKIRDLRGLIPCSVLSLIPYSYK
jgi:hypothetical protein